MPPAHTPLSESNAPSPFSLSPTRTRVILLALVLLAVGLRLLNAAAMGDGNTYYTAAVENMLRSPSNFFFAVADAGSVTVDKPPVALWIQSAFAAVLGVNGLAVTLPSIIAGVASVLILYHLVRKQFGRGAGLIAAFVLAITPIAIAVDRSNNLDSILILTLLLATWAFMRAVETGRWRPLLLGAVLIGVGFNVKMMQAYLILPALFAFYLFSTRVSWSSKFVRLSVAVVILVVVSLSWMLIVDAIPADQRPYIGSSQTNSAVELALGYNGLQRLLGVQLPNQPTGNIQTGSPPASAPGGSGEVGTPGLLRLFTQPLSDESGWLLPFGLLALALLAVSQRVRLPLSREHQAVLLWGGWLLTGAVYFSIASFFHAYYLATLAPALAALVGIGSIKVWQWTADRQRAARLLLALMAAGLVVFQLSIAGEVGIPVTGLAVVAGLVGLAGAFGLLAGRLNQESYRLMVGVALLSTVLLIPTVWGVATMADPQQSATLPHAYAGDTAAAGVTPLPGDDADSPLSGLVDYLQAAAGGETYVLAVPSATIGAKITLESALPVLYLNGFNGSDVIQTADSVAQLVTAGELRFIMPVSSTITSQAEITTWVETNCTLVAGLSELPLQPTGDGTGSRPLPPGGGNGGQPPTGAPGVNGVQPPTGGPGMMNANPTGLYDCANVATGVASGS